jgi:glyoxylase-like metal-dependent hydrolase (beta-lactamase superfamily II)
MQRATLGDFELISVNDGGYYLDGGAMFGVVPKPLWSKLAPSDEQNRIRLGLNTVVVRTGEHTVVIETGIGNKLPEKLQKIYGNEPQLLGQLDEAGVDPEEVDIVINTHLHFDHCGWNTQKKPNGTVVPIFPRARYYFQRLELEHAHEQHERDYISYISDNYDPLLRNGQGVVLDGDAEIVPGVSVRLYSGHTRGHQGVIIESQGKRACYVGDLIPTIAHLQPTWVMAYDLFPLETIANRHRFYDEAVPEKWLVMFTHDPKIPWAHVSLTEEGKYVAEAVDHDEVVKAR